MYNRYIPTDGYRPVEPERGTGREERNQRRGGAFERLFSMLSGGSGTFGLDQVDKGDILLVLVLIFLFKESEDEEWLIILALVLLMGLG